MNRTMNSQSAAAVNSAIISVAGNTTIVTSFSDAISVFGEALRIEKKDIVAEITAGDIKTFMELRRDKETKTYSVCCVDFIVDTDIKTLSGYNINRMAATMAHIVCDLMVKAGAQYADVMDRSTYTEKVMDEVAKEYAKEYYYNCCNPNDSEYILEYEQYVYEWERRESGFAPRTEDQWYNWDIKWTEREYVQWEDAICVEYNKLVEKYGEPKFEEAPVTAETAVEKAPVFVDEDAVVGDIIEKYTSVVDGIECLDLVSYFADVEKEEAPVLMDETETDETADIEERISEFNEYVRDIVYKEYQDAVEQLEEQSWWFENPCTCVEYHKDIEHLWVEWAVEHRVCGYNDAYDIYRVSDYRVLFVDNDALAEYISQFGGNIDYIDDAEYLLYHKPAGWSPNKKEAVERVWSVFCDAWDTMEDTFIMDIEKTRGRDHVLGLLWECVEEELEKRVVSDLSPYRDVFEEVVNIYLEEKLEYLKETGEDHLKFGEYVDYEGYVETYNEISSWFGLPSYQTA